MAVNGLGSYTSSKTRVSGLGGSGLDIDSIVSSLMKVEQVPIDKLGQKVQTSQWKMDAYREVTSTLSGFKSGFLDILNPATNMTSYSTYKKFISSVTNNSGSTSNVVSVTANSSASVGNHTIVVNKMATADIAQSASVVTGSTVNIGSGVNVSAGTGFQIALDGGTAQGITFSSNTTYSTMNDLVTDLQSKIDTAVGGGKVAVSYNASNQLTFSTTGGAKSIQILSGTDGAGTNDALASINVAAGKSQGITAALTGKALPADVSTLAGKDFTMTLDGVSKTITIGNYATAGDLATGLQAQIGQAFGKTPSGTDKVNVNLIGGSLNFTTNDSSVNRITLYSGGTNDGLAGLGFSSGVSNRLVTGLSLAQLKNSFATPLVFEGGATNVTSSQNVTIVASTPDTVNPSALKDKSFSMTVDGVTRSYKFDSDPTDVDDVATKLNAWATEQFGAGAVNITAVDSGDGGKKLSFTRGSSEFFTLNSGSSGKDALKIFNIMPDSEASSQLKFTINSQEFTIKASNSLTGMMSTINSNTDAKVMMTYDENNDVFKITAKQLGAGDNIMISQGAGSGNFFSGASMISTGRPVTTQGVDAQVTIDGQDLVRSSNTVTVAGVTYTLLRESADTQNVSLSSDVNTVYDNIKKFVDKYNEVIASLNTKVSEKYDKTYQPLTDEQKSSMTEDQVKKWETKAQTGLLHNDSIIGSALFNMRSALTKDVKGVNTNLAKIGITTGTYDENGKLYIDEDKLKAAIQNDPDSVMNLFAQQSDISYTGTGARSQRYNEEGLAYRLQDILNDNIRTSRDSNGYKGTLLQQAGMEGDASEYDNLLFKEIYDNEKRITDLTDKLADKEEAFYKKYTAMEQAISKMQSQMTSLTKTLGG